jgi:hypothetical protein
MPPYTIDANGRKHYKPECLSIGSTLQPPARLPTPRPR